VFPSFMLTGPPRRGGARRVVVRQRALLSQCLSVSVVVLVDAIQRDSSASFADSAVIFVSL